VRFAPSPTGPYILAAFVHYSIICLPKKQCDFLPKIEDTDQNDLFRCRRIYHGSSRMVRIAPDETIGKMKIWLPKRKKDLYQQYA
jgi:hypothetical protein